MKLSTALFFLGGVSTATAAGLPYSLHMASSMLSRSPPLGLTRTGSVMWNYEHALFERALWRSSSIAPPSLAQNFTAAATLGVNYLFDSNGTLQNFNISVYSLDSLCVGGVLLDLYTATKEEKYRVAAQGLMGQLYTQPRNPQGGFWHQAQFPDQMWLDGLYMQAPFYAQHTAIFQPKNKTAWADIANQFKLAYTNTRVNSTGLLYHAYDASGVVAWADPDRGHSPEVWDRALGWFMMALVDVLDWFPRSQPGFRELVGYTRALSGAIRRGDGEDGWWLVMGRPGEVGNYRESSGSAMFLYAILKAARKGYLGDRAVVTETQRWGTEKHGELVEAFVRDNEGNSTLSYIETCAGVGIRANASAAFYYDKKRIVNDLKGVGPFVLASLEVERVH